ncbi:zinc finger protein 678-like isoform X2 [Trichoplusia ni]|uniref:Zinc finger protein 678-like isoform X2 n=1 Tax=Trichoplusia ni TaxID=7111 RepID=A0A7E5X5F6_TRINI|nr:zinc finger protein 678-like isoform X2 [Trichoplusia ni]
MDVKVKTFTLSCICEGCLSTDRELIEITESHIKEVFYELILNEAGNQKKLLLCWECKGNIQRFLVFKQQVKDAHNTLNQYMLNQNIQYSKFSITKDNDVPNVADFKEDGTEQPFIKVEDQGFADVDYFNEDYDRDDDVDSKEITAVLDTGYVEPSKAKSRGKSKKKVEDEFNDSDEEPLKCKKNREGARVKKKKKEDGSPKLDRRKNPAPKREKPPGVVNNPRVAKKLQQLNVAQGQLEMVVLSWAEVEAERQRGLSSEAFTRQKYRCEDCVLGFNHKFKLDNHMKKHDESAGTMVCEVCKVRCRDAHALCAHRRRHRVRWRCCRCGRSVSRAAVAADHVAREHHAPPPTHACRLCGHEEPTLGKLRNHIKNHAERQKCELCGKTFRDRTSLRTHLFIHKGEKEYSCPRCDKRFLFKKAMEVHLVTHDAPAHLYCYECDMNFKNRMSYTQHMKYSLKHIDPAKLKYACQLCDKKFVKAIRLEEHNLAVHLKATPIRCTAQGCNFACSSRAVLRAHSRCVHRHARALRNHVCHACGKTYTTKKSLEGHLRSHTGERPFKCTECPSTFGYEAALYNHNKLVHLKPKTGRARPPPIQIPAAPTELT